jgi:hypothetical protein
MSQIEYVQVTIDKLRQMVDCKDPIDGNIMPGTSERSSAIAAIVDSDCVGYAIVDRHDDHASIRYAQVRSDYRRKGICTALVKSVIELTPGLEIRAEPTSDYMESTMSRLGFKPGQSQRLSYSDQRIAEFRQHGIRHYPRWIRTPG